MQFENIREKLKLIGLGHNESKIYLVLIKLGPSMAGRIAKEANIDRSACYDSLKALLKKGLVKYVLESNRKKFSATPPERLKDYLNEKKEIVEEIIPDLKEMFNKTDEKSQVSMYKGKKGIKSVFQDILKEAKGKENLVIDSSGEFVKKMPYYSSHFINGLEKNKIKVRHIIQKNKKEEVHPSKTTNLRFFPNPIAQTIITTNIYADKIAMILWIDIPEAVIIKNEFAAQAYKNYFEILWKSSHKK